MEKTIENPQSPEENDEFAKMIKYQIFFLIKMSCIV